MSAKRILSYLLLSSLTLPAFAGEFSIGAGALSTTMYSRFTYFNGDFNTQVTTTGTSISGEFYGGYAYNVNKGFDLGIEVFYDLGGPEIENNIVTPGYVKNSLGSTYGLRIVPGFNITPSTRMIAAVGYAMLNTTISIQDTHPVLTFATDTGTKKGGSLFYGAGIETMIYNSVGLRAAYYVMNGAQSIASVTSTNTFPTGGNEIYKAKPVVNTFYLGGIFRFTFK